MDGAIRLAVIGDDRVLLAGLTAWLVGAPDFELRATAPTVAEYLAGAPDVDVVLLDMNLRDTSEPHENVARLRAEGLRVLVMSTIPDAEDVLATLAAGAAGFVPKDHDLDALATAVRAVAAGGSVVTPELAFIISRDARPNRPELSEQERTVLVAYATGSTLAAAARAAGVTPDEALERLAGIRRRYAGCDVNG